MLHFMAQLNVKMSDELVVALRERSARTGVPISRFVRDALEQALGGVASEPRSPEGAKGSKVNPDVPPAPAEVPSAAEREKVLRGGQGVAYGSFNRPTQLCKKCRVGMVVGGKCTSCRAVQ